MHETEEKISDGTLLEYINEIICRFTRDGGRLIYTEEKEFTIESKKTKENSLGILFFILTYFLV